MKLNVEHPTVRTMPDGEIRLSFTVSQENRYLVKSIMQDLVKWPKIALDMKKYRNSRSANQNRLMWALLEIMAQEQGCDAWECYIDILEKHGARFEYFECLTDAYETLKKTFRAVKIVDERTKLNGRKTYMCKAFCGSSNYDTQEMNTLIESIFDELAQMGIQDDKEVAYLWAEHQASCKTKKKAISAGRDMA